METQNEANEFAAGAVPQEQNPVEITMEELHKQITARILGAPHELPADVIAVLDCIILAGKLNIPPWALKQAEEEYPLFVHVAEALIGAEQTARAMVMQANQSQVIVPNRQMRRHGIH